MELKECQHCGSPIGQSTSEWVRAVDLNAAPVTIGPTASEMLLRDYFAVEADGPDEDQTAEWVAACLGWDNPNSAPGDYRAWFLWWREALAAWKYAEADAMLRAREK